MKVAAATRSRARHFAMQAIYQWQMAGSPPHVIEAEFHADNDMKKVDTDYFHELFHGAISKRADLDAMYDPFLTSKKKQELDPVTLSLLRMSCYEFKARVDVPYRVVINESVNLAKKFGAEDSHKFINGVLDKVAGVAREVEVNAERNK